MMGHYVLLESVLGPSVGVGLCCVFAAVAFDVGCEGNGGAVAPFVTVTGLGLELEEEEESSPPFHVCPLPHFRVKYLHD